LFCIDFHNEQVVKLFGKQLEKIGERKQGILQERLEQRAKIQQHMDQFRLQNSQVQKQLDEAIEQLEDKFADSANILEYDMERLSKKYLGDKPIKQNTMIPCLTERSDIATCYQHHRSDPDTCSAFVRELVNCTEKTITSDNQ
jgi:isopropylmalate/homocitrate/citramalate synthase